MNAASSLVALPVVLPLVAGLSTAGLGVTVAFSAGLVAFGAGGQRRGRFGAEKAARNRATFVLETGIAAELALLQLLLFVGYLSLYFVFAEDAGFQPTVYWLVVIAAVHMGLRVVDALAVAGGYDTSRHVTMFVSNYLAFLAVGASMLRTTSLQVFYGNVSAMPVLLGLSVYAALAVLGETVYYEVRYFRQAELRGFRKSHVRFLLFVVAAALTAALVTHALCAFITSTFSVSGNTQIDASAGLLFWLHVASIAVGGCFLVYWLARFNSPAFDASAWAVGLAFGGKAVLMAASSVAAASSLPNVGIIGALSSLAPQSGVSTVSNLALLQWVAWTSDVAFVVGLFLVDYVRRTGKPKDELVTPI